MHTYGQYCALAKTLDVVGGRWTLLIVRELLIRGPSRYTDLRTGMPGIATNLLAERLRDLEENGVVESFYAPRPIATNLFRLTPQGKQLEPALQLLGQWGVPLLAKAAKSDVFCSHWIVLPARHYLKDQTPDRPPVRIEVRTGEDPLSIQTRDGEVVIEPGAIDNPDLVITGGAPLVLGVLLGKLDFATAQTRGLSYEGNPKALRRLQPSTASTRRN